MHGDIKPNNVLVSGDEAFLIDYGVSCKEGRLGRRGTDGYIAPEVDAEGSSTHASDMWSLGRLIEDSLGEMVLSAECGAVRSDGSGVVWCPTTEQCGSHLAEMVPANVEKVTQGSVLSQTIAGRDEAS